MNIPYKLNAELTQWAVYILTLLVANHQPTGGRGREGELVGGGGGGGSTQHSSPPGAMSFIGTGSKVATLESIQMSTLLSRLYRVSSLSGACANHKQLYDDPALILQFLCRDDPARNLEFCNSCVEMTRLEFCNSVVAHS